METPELHRRAVDFFGRHVAAVGGDQWDALTPCDDWNVRTLVNHVVYEELWTAPLFAGKTIAEVGDVFDGDVLGAAPQLAYEAAAGPAKDAVDAPGAMTRTVPLSFGDTPGSEYAMQLFADHLIHGWDLARAIGADDTLDPELVDACAQWFSDQEKLYRDGGSIGPRVEVPSGADAQTRLLAAFGRSGDAAG